MSKGSFGSTPCYICKAPLAPLVSICWVCGYSQLPNPNAQGDVPVEGRGQDGAAPKRAADLDKRLDLNKADFKSGIRKK